MTTNLRKITPAGNVIFVTEPTVKPGAYFGPLLIVATACGAGVKHVAPGDMIYVDDACVVGRLPNDNIHFIRENNVIAILGYETSHTETAAASVQPENAEFE